MREKIAVDSLFLNLSTRCNMTCARCYGHLDDFAREDMDLATAQEATALYLDNRREKARHPFVMLFGGEPLLNWDVAAAYVAWFRGLPAARSCRLDLFTNGLLLDRERYDFLRRHAVHLFLSLDGDYESCSRNRPIGHEGFERIRAIIEANRRFDIITPYCVFSKRDLGRLRANLDFIASLGFSEIAVAKDFFEILSAPEKRAALGAIFRSLVLRGKRVLIYPEIHSNCTTCRPNTILVYPDGEIYDLCYVCASVAHRKGGIGRGQKSAMRFGNLRDGRELFFDTGQKRALMVAVGGGAVPCPTLSPRISLARKIL